MKRGTLVLMVMLGCPAASAQDPSGGERFDDKRLFTTAPQREHLDALREGTPPPERSAESRRQTAVPVPEETDEAKKPPSVELQGFVRSDEGRSAVWANGENTLNGDTIGGELRVDSGRIDGRTVMITLPNGRTARLRPGQVWDPETGRVRDEYLRKSRPGHGAGQ